MEKGWCDPRAPGAGLGGEVGGGRGEDRQSVLKTFGGAEMIGQ